MKRGLCGFQQEQRQSIRLRTCEIQENLNFSHLAVVEYYSLTPKATVCPLHDAGKLLEPLEVSAIVFLVLETASVFTIHKAEEIKSYVECDAERKVAIVILQRFLVKTEIHELIASRANCVLSFPACSQACSIKHRKPVSEFCLVLNYQKNCFCRNRRIKQS